MLPTLNAAGMKRRLGLLAPPVSERGKTSFRVFEDSVELLPMADIVRVAKSGLMDGRIRFGRKWVVDQLSYGSCNGWASATATSKARVLRGLRFVALSGTSIYMLINGNRDNGSTLESGMRAIQQHGIATVQTIPASVIYQSQLNATARAKAEAERRLYRADDCFAITTLHGRWSALAQGYLVVSAVHAGRNFDRLNQHGICGVDAGHGNHAIHEDGLIWIDGIGLVSTAENSWGLRWGIEGRMQLTEEHVRQTIGVHLHYAIPTTSDGDDAPPEVRS